MDHVTDFLGPYLDGELQASHNAKIEKHLEICKSCRVELAELQKLGTLLQDNAQLPETKSEDQFVAEVGLLMKRQTEPTALKRVLVTGWKAIPVSLAGTWLFVQTSLIVTTLFYFVSRFAPELPGIAQLSPTSSPTVWSNVLGSINKPLITQVLEFITHNLNLDIQLNWRIPVFTILAFAIGTLYVCWLASWWVVRERKVVYERRITQESA